MTRGRIMAARAMTPIVVKAIGTDARGRRVAAWAEIPDPDGRWPMADGREELIRR